MSPYDADQDHRLDPRVRVFVQSFQFGTVARPDVASRQELLDEAQSPEGVARYQMMKQALDAADVEDIAPKHGLRVDHYSLTSSPDGNTINMQFIRPDDDTIYACLYYIHGGGMRTMSCFDGNYRAWGRILAAKGLAVAMIDFRNSIEPSSVPEVAPYPAGLNDCVSGFHWVRENAQMLGVDPDQMVIAGESGGNLSIATTMKLVKEGKGDLVKGLYALCPYLAGDWPLPENPSSIENEGILLALHNNHGAMAYGVEAHAARDPMAWPGFASEADVAGFPPTMISVNECDPLRDEGVNFYRLLRRAGVTAQCRQVMGTCHGTEIFPSVAPDISHTTARDIKGWVETCCQ